MKVGFVGLGNLGFFLASNIAKAGHQLAVCDLQRDLAQPLVDAGATFFETPAEVAGHSEVVITCLPSAGAIESAVTGKTGILVGFGDKGGAWIDMSTNDRENTLALKALAESKGVEMLEAPVTGGVHKAATGDITVLVGATKAQFERYLPLLKCVGDPVLHIGEVGDAASIKVITNMLAFINLVSVGEALMLAKKSGLDLATSFEAIKHSSGTSFVHETEGQVILNGSYNISFTMDLALKDLGFAMEMGRRLNVPLDLASQTAQTFVRAKAHYGGSAWSSQVVKLLEDAVGEDLRAEGFPETLW